MNPATLTGLVIACGFIIWAILRVGELAFVELRRKGKVRVFWFDPDGGDMRVGFYERKGNEITVGKGEDARTYILDARARIPARYPTYMIHSRHGWNLSIPTDSETVEQGKLLKRLVVSNPASYHKAISRNKARDGLRANERDDKLSWVMPVAIVACVALAGMFGMLAYVVHKIAGGAA